MYGESGKFEDTGSARLRSRITGFAAQIAFAGISRKARKQREQNPVWEIPPETPRLLNPEEELNIAKFTLGRKLESIVGFDNPELSEPEVADLIVIPADSTSNRKAYRIHASFTGDSGSLRSSVYRIGEFEPEVASQVTIPESTPSTYITVSLTRNSPHNDLPSEMRFPESVEILSTPIAAPIMGDVSAIEELTQVVTAFEEMESHSNS